jgi:hypothetical protein
MAEVCFDVPLDVPDEWRTLLEREVQVLRDHMQAAAQLVGGLQRLHGALAHLSAQHVALDVRLGDTPTPTLAAAVDTLTVITRTHEASHANLVAARQALRAMVVDLAAVLDTERM